MSIDIDPTTLSISTIYHQVNRSTMGSGGIFRSKCLEEHWRRLKKIPTYKKEYDLYGINKALKEFKISLENAKKHVNDLENTIQNLEEQKNNLQTNNI